MVIFFFVGAAGWGVVLYQQRLVSGSEGRVRDAVLKELQERMNIQDSVKDEVAKKERDLVFVMQQEYQRSLEDQVAGKFAEYENRYSALDQELRQNLGSKLADFGRKQLDYVQQLDLFGGQLKEYEKELKEAESRAAASRRELLQRLKDLDARLSRQQEDSDKKGSGYSRELEELRGQIAGLRSRVAGLSGELARIKERLPQEPAE